MGKLVLFLSFVAIALLFVVSLVDPTNPIVWLASTSVNFAILRVVMMLGLLALLSTNPPRNIYLRMIVGLFAVGLTGWSLGATYQNDMKFLDTMTLLLFSTSAGIVVLEREPEALLPVAQPFAKKA